MALRELTGLLSFLTFLTIEKYYQKAVSLLNFRPGKKTLKLKAAPAIYLPIKSHQLSEEGGDTEILFKLFHNHPLTSQSTKIEKELQKI